MKMNASKNDKQNRHMLRIQLIAQFLPFKILANTITKYGRSSSDLQALLGIAK